MSVTIIRRTGWLGMAARIAIAVNGEKKARIGFRENLQLSLPTETAVLSVSQFGAKSNAVEVKDGDTVELKTSIWTKAVIGILLVYVFMGNVFPSDIYLNGFYVLAILSLFVGLFLNSFYLKVM